MNFGMNTVCIPLLINERTVRHIGYPLWECARIHLNVGRRFPPPLNSQYEFLKQHELGLTVVDMRGGQVLTL